MEAIFGMMVLIIYGIIFVRVAGCMGEHINFVDMLLKFFKSLISKFKKILLSKY